MFDKVHTYISLFRCNFCLELLPVSGSLSMLDKQKVYLVTENPSKYLKHYDRDEATHMYWIACCAECMDGGSMDEYLFPPNNRALKHFTPHEDAPTVDALTRLMASWGLTIGLKSRLMNAAHFDGDRPVL